MCHRNIITFEEIVERIVFQRRQRETGTQRKAESRDKGRDRGRGKKGRGGRQSTDIRIGTK